MGRWGDFFPCASSRRAKHGQVLEGVCVFRVTVVDTPLRCKRERDQEEREPFEIPDEPSPLDRSKMI